MEAAADDVGGEEDDRVLSLLHTSRTWIWPPWRHRVWDKKINVSFVAVMNRRFGDGEGEM
jgi:hypothetical protein